MTQEELDLLHGYLNGSLDEAGFDRLQALLRASADARRTLRTLSTVETKLQQLAALSPAAVQLLAAPSRRERVSTRWLGRRSGVVGLMAGLIGASVAWATVLPWLGEARETVRTVFTESFESGVTKTAPGLPREPGQWAGDEAEVAMAGQGIEPRHGARMLRFRRATYPGENSPRSQWSDVYRLVEVQPLPGEGRTVARVTASFAAVAAAEGARFSCSVQAFALGEELSSLPSPLVLSWLSQNHIASASRKLTLSAPRVWQSVSAEVPLTPQTRFVMLHLAVIQEQPAVQAGAVEFPGHYMDDVTVELINRP
jgi:hypothetical protein